MTIASPTLEVTALTTWMIFLTFPDTVAWMGTDTYPPASAIFCPTFTSSPRFTRAFAGAPMCWLRGRVTTEGRGAVSILTSRAIL